MLFQFPKVELRCSEHLLSPMDSRSLTLSFLIFHTAIARIVILPEF